MEHRIGIDEAGRGSWAGPLVVGACLIPLENCDEPPAGLTDSKKLTPKRRAALVDPIRAWATAWATGHATPHEIDALGVTKASRLAAHRALHRLRFDLRDVDHVLLDGNVDYITGPTPGKAGRAFALHLPPVRTLVKADLTDPACSAASILAKTHHDHVIAALAAHYPQYNWLSGMGYPTAAHAEAVREHGLSNQHRRSWGARKPGRTEPPAAAISGTVIEQAATADRHLWDEDQIR